MTAMDPDQQEDHRRARAGGPVHLPPFSDGGDYRTFRLTEADAALVDEVCQMRPWVYLRNTDDGARGRLIRATWTVIGERHGFDPATATEHPDGGPQVLAKPARRTRSDLTPRGGQ